ncbi:MAG: hypothetical protein AAF990_26925 [Bacteroidota bacterium]
MKKYDGLSRSLCHYALLLLIFSFSACEVSTLEEDLLNESSSSPNQVTCSFCEIVFQGKVKDGKEIMGDPNNGEALMGLSDAVICSPYFKGESDENGCFRIEIRDPFDLSSLNREIVLRAYKMGYVTSVIRINPFDYFDVNDCPGSAIEINLDFVLTPEQSNVFSITSEQSTNQFTDVFVSSVEFEGMELREEFKSNYLFNVPANALPAGEAAEVRITPLHFDHYAGAFKAADGSFGEPIKHLSFQPAGLTFTEKVVLTFTPDRPLSDDETLGFFTLEEDMFDCQSLNPDDLYWEEEQEVEFSYNAATNEVSMTFQRFPSYGLITVDSKPIEIGLSEIKTGPGLNQATYSNCECGDPTVRTFEYAYRSTAELCLEEESTENERIRIRRLLRTFLNVPGPMTTFSEVEKTEEEEDDLFCDVFTIGDVQKGSRFICIGKCELKSVEAFQRGTFVEGEYCGQPFTFCNLAVVSVLETMEVCPTTTECHQGCTD